MFRNTRGLRSSDFTPEMEQGQKRACRKDNGTMAEKPNLFSAIIEVDQLALLKNSLCENFWVSLKQKIDKGKHNSRVKRFQRKGSWDLNDIDWNVVQRIIWHESMAKTKLRIAADTLLLALPQLDHEHTMCMSLTCGNQFYWCSATLF